MPQAATMSPNGTGSSYCPSCLSPDCWDAKCSKKPGKPAPATTYQNMKRTSQGVVDDVKQTMHQLQSSFTRGHADLKLRTDPKESAKVTKAAAPLSPKSLQFQRARVKYLTGHR